MNAPVRLNPYLAGNFAPVREEVSLHDLPIVGIIPEGLNGTFYRNGPNPQFPPRDPNHHWFAGDGMLHAFRVEGGRVAYANRYVRTPKWELEHKAGCSLFGTFGNPMTSAAEVVGKDGGLANTNVIWHAGRLLALEEGHQPFEVDPKDLSPRGYRDYAGKAGRFTAHPKIDPETGELVFFGYGVGDTPLANGLVYGVADKNGKVTRLDRFDAPFTSMVHDFLVTRSHVLFPILPLTGSIARAMAGGPAFAWEPEKGSHIGVMRRDSGVETMRWYTTDPCYVFHPMNAWEEGDKIFADVMQYPVAPLFPNADGSRGEPTDAKLVRWTFDLAGQTNTIAVTPLDDLPGEFPRLDERRAGLSYRYGYFAGSAGSERLVQFNTIARIDHKARSRSDWVLPKGDFVGEPVFVPRTPDAAEGDGWLVTIIYRGASNSSDFVVLDANDVARGPVGIAKLPVRVPFGFHGNWV